MHQGDGKEGSMDGWIGERSMQGFLTAREHDCLEREVVTAVSTSPDRAGCSCNTVLRAPNMYNRTLYRRNLSLIIKRLSRSGGALIFDHRGRKCESSVMPDSILLYCS